MIREIRVDTEVVYACGDLASRLGCVFRIIEGALEKRNAICGQAVQVPVYESSVRMLPNLNAGPRDKL